MSGCGVFDSLSLVRRPLIQQRYRLLQCLGRGNFAQTYLGQDLQADCQPLVVLKQIRSIQTNRSLAAIAQTFFDQEVEFLQRLEPLQAIPSLLNVFAEHDEQYLVQAFIPGKSLQDEFNQGLLWTEAQLLNFLVHALEILAAIHDAGVIHRDLKPAHWIWRQDATHHPSVQAIPLALIDFGAAAPMHPNDPLATPKTVHAPPTLSIGTQDYMAPEQHRGHADVRSDLYALGLIAIQGMVGIRPSQLERNTQGELRWQPQLPIRGAVVDIVTRMVRYQPQDRYGSAREVLSDLHSYARSPLWSRRVSRWLGLGLRSASQPVNPNVQRPTAKPPLSTVSRHPSGWSRSTVLISAWHEVPQTLLADLEAAVSTHLWISDGGMLHPERAEAQQAGLDAAFQSTDAYILCLTPESITNPKLLQQLQGFAQCQQHRGDRPARLIPVRINLGLADPLPDAVRQALRQVRQYVWRSPADTPRILAAIQESLPHQELMATSDANHGDPREALIAMA